MSNDPYQLALKWLTGRRLTVKELSERLRRRSVSGPECDATVHRLIELGLLDDDGYARDLVREASEHLSLGPTGVRNRLFRRGFARDLVDQAIAGQSWDWVRIAERVAERYDITDPRSQARLIRRLIREGFPNQVIRQVITISEADGLAEGI